MPCHPSSGSNMIFNQIPIRNIHNYSTAPRKRYQPNWNIKFSGIRTGLNVHDFLFRLERMATTHGLEVGHNKRNSLH